MSAAREHHTKRAKTVARLAVIARTNLQYVVRAASHGHVRRAWEQPDHNGPGCNPDDEVRDLLRRARIAIDAAEKVMRTGGLD